MGRSLNCLGAYAHADILQCFRGKILQMGLLLGTPNPGKHFFLDLKLQGYAERYRSPP